VYVVVEEGDPFDALIAYESTPQQTRQFVLLRAGVRYKGAGSQ
jgi:hypothetical protein